MASVFISHSSADNQLAAEIKGWLAEQGFESVFLDIDEKVGIPPGARWERELYRKIEAAQAMILIITPRWHESKWCFVEFAQARALGKAIFPVVVAPDATRYVASDIQQLDLQIDRAGGLERLSRELTRLAVDAQGGFPWDRRRPPYPGFMFFEEDDAAIFFGRDDDIRLIIERLNASRVRGGARIIALLGASGSGKSSVLRAGVLPRLRREKRNWVVLPPFRPGQRPIEEMARAVSEALGSPQAWSQWSGRLAGPEKLAALTELVDTLRLAANAREAQILLTVDQTEELFTLTPADERSRFLSLLSMAASENANFLSVMALRSDYLGSLQSVAGLASFEEVSLRPFPLARVRTIIQGPARVAGISVEPELVDRAVADMGTDDALPLLAFTLRELYDEVAGRREDGHRSFDLSLGSYLALSKDSPDLNPLESAVQKRAKQVLAGLQLAEQDLEALRDAFVQSMVRVDAEGAYARKRADWDAIPERAKPILEKLAAARLCVIATEDGKKTVEVTHEALLRKWSLLRSWLDARRDFLVGRVQLGYALKSWDDEKIDKDAALLGGLTLSRARQWLKTHPESLSSQEKAFIDASAAYHDARERRAARGRWLAWGAAAIIVAVIGLSTFLYREQHASQLRATATSLAVQARSNLQNDPVRALDLAVRSVATLPSAETQSTLLSSVLSVSPNVLRIHGVTAPGSRAVFGADASTVFLGEVEDNEERVSIWRPADGEGTDILDAAKRAKHESTRHKLIALSEENGAATAVFNDGRVQFLDAQGTIVGTARLKDIDQADLASFGSKGNMIVEHATDGDVYISNCANAGGAIESECAVRKVASGFPAVIELNRSASLAALAYDDGRLTIVDVVKDPIAKDVSIGPDTFVSKLAWSSDGTHLAVGTTTGRILILDRTGVVQAEAQQKGNVALLSWAAGSQRLATTCDANAICVWNARQSGVAMSLDIIGRFYGHTGPIKSLAFAAGGDQLVSLADAPDRTLRLWSVAANDPAFGIAGTWQKQATFTTVGVSADGRWLAAGDNTGSVHLWPFGQFGQESILHGEGSSIVAMAWAPNKPEVAIADASNTIAIKSWPDADTSRRIPVGHRIYAMAWLASGPTLFVGGNADGSVSWIKPGDTAPSLFDKRNRDMVVALAASPDNKTLIAADPEQIGRWNLTPVQFQGFHSSETSRDSVTFSPDGMRYLTAGNGGEVLVYPAEGGSAPLRCQSGSKQLDGATFDSSGTVIAAVSADAILHLWNVARDCTLLASASLASVEARNTAYRAHLVSIAGRNAVAVVSSTRQVAVISLDPSAWLARARRVLGRSPDARTN